MREAVAFKNKKPVFRNIEKPPEALIDISFPVSETIDFEGRARGLLGVKHGPIAETVGVSNEEIAEKLGIGGYTRSRLKKATEDDTFPKLVYTLDAESLQERTEAETKRKSVDTEETPDDNDSETTEE